MSFTTLVS